MRQVRGQVADEPGGLRLRQPVGGHESQIERSVSEASSGKQMVVQRIELQRLDLEARIAAASAGEVGKLPGDRTLKRSELPNGYPNPRAHACLPRVSAPPAMRWRRRSFAALAACPRDSSRLFPSTWQW